MPSAKRPFGPAKSRIRELVSRHARTRADGINLIASENTMPALASEALASDLQGRYHADFYGGSGVVRDIIAETEALARKAYRAKHALVTPLSGNICDLAVLHALTRPGDGYASLHFSSGGYPLGFGHFGREHVRLPSKAGTFDVDADKAKAVIASRRPAVTMLGASYIPFPHPVRELEAAVRASGGRFVYDGAHVMGLIGCCEFQDPLAEGAEVLIGSTHKSLFGPQGGLILTNDAGLAERLRAQVEIDLVDGISLVDNPHPARIAALGIALETLLANRAYGKRVIRNAQALAKALDEQGVAMKFKPRGYTRSHQAFLEVDEPGAARACARLERAGIFIDTAGRMGAAECARRGMGGAEMSRIAELLAGVLKGGSPTRARKDVRSFAREWPA